MLSKSQAKTFFLAGTAVCSLAFIALTVDTFQRIPAQTKQSEMTESVIRGKHIFDRSNCMGCHTIMGEGGYYAPELTKAFERRGEAFLRAIIKDPQVMYPNDRKMVKYDFSDEEISDLVAFLKWVGNMDLNGFPPKPDLVNTASPSASGDADAVVKKIDRPLVFNQMCIACHTLEGQGGKIGPALDGLGSRRDANFIRTWLKDPIAVKADSKMPKLPLSENDITELTAFLSLLKESKMKYRSQTIAYWFFAACMLLLSLQIVYGFIMGFAHMGFDVLHQWIPFNVARTTHTNLLVMWMLMGFMGAAYYIIPEEADRELIYPKLAYVQLISFLAVGVTAVIGFHFGWWEGRKFLEIPRPLDYLVVVNVLLFIYLIGGTIWTGRRQTTTSMVLFFGLLTAALLYLPGMIPTDNQSFDSYWRWWVVHLWVEGVWELIMGAILSFLLIKLTGVDREIIEKWLYIIVGFTFLSGILGTGHHYYFIGTPRYWLWVGGLFSALEPVAFLGMAIYAVAMAKKGGRNPDNRTALNWAVGCSILSFVGAGFLGFAHTLPQVNRYTHGTLVTAMHGHLAFWGAYAMLILAMITYTMPYLTGRKLQDSNASVFAFWCSNIGMVSMTCAFAVAGISQVYLERKVGLDFLTVQKEIEVHFIGLVLAAALFTLGIGSFIWNFIRFGRPVWQGK